MQSIGTHGGEVMYVVIFCFRGEHGFLKCVDICMCVVNKQFELLEFPFKSVYVYLNEILSDMRACVVCVIMWWSLVSL